jgi:hypothetical protein
VSVVFVDSRPPRPAARQVFAFCIAVSLGLVAVTGAVRFGLGHPGLEAVLRRMSLATENGLGAWWSGLLLAVLALLAWDGVGGARGRLAGAWAVVAGVLAFLSLDEVGSLHERLGGLGLAWGVGEWGLVLPLGAALGLPLGWALLVIGREAGWRRAIMLGVGFALLGSVAVQEYFEHKLVWPDGVVSAVRVMVEEGTELVGMLLLMATLRANTALFDRESAAAGRPALDGLGCDARRLLLAAVLLAPVLLWLTLLVAEGDGRGRAADWLAMVLFAGAGLALSRGPLLRGGGPGALAAWLAAGAALAASLAVLVVPPTSVREVMGTEAGTRLLVLALLGVALALAAAIAAFRRGASPLPGLALALLAAVLSWLGPTPLAALAGSLALGIAAFASLAGAGEATAPAAQPLPAE